MCLRNNTAFGLFNGMQGRVTAIHKDERLSFVSDEVLYPFIQYDPDQFGKEKNEFVADRQVNPFDYAYGITCHKAQGDQFQNIIVYEQFCQHWDHWRWAYTAASRAMSGEIWISEESFIPYYLV
jgi:exodeoxyribonuclease-5